MADLDQSTYVATLDYGRHPRTIQCSCSSCSWTGAASRLKPIEDCSLTPGDASPAGRCPKYASLVYADPSDVLIVDRSSLEEDLRSAHPLPWIAQHGNGQVPLHFEDEVLARAYQRAWRRAHRMDLETGARLLLE